ncbi:MAG: hypothetical protein HOP19_00430 [Acidobacteria bacterium]|nr:hypothetical protein [Acidobacteriota bacterium]
MNDNRKTRWLTAVLCVLVTTIAVIPFFYLGEDRAVGCCGGAMPITHDAWMHYNQMNAFARGLSAGRIYPRWDEATDKGYGAPVTSFYPPGVYYLTSLAYAVTRDWIRTWMLSYWLMSFAAAWAMYVYARRHLTRTAAWLAMAAYTIAPYHLLNQYQRGAQSELLSFVWMPLCLLFAERLPESLKDESPRMRAALGLAASYGAFLWSHPPTAYQFTLVAGVCLLVRIVWLRQWRALGWITLSLIGGSLLAAAYLYPAFLEQHLIHADSVNHTWPYHQTYVFDYVQTTFKRDDWFYARVDWLWFSATALLFSLSAASAWPRCRAGYQPALHLGIGTLAAFLMTRLSFPIGQLIPHIEIGVFAWRMLGLTSLALALLIGACWQAAGGRRILAILATCGLIGISFYNVVWPMVRGEAFVPNPQHFNFATLPATAPREVPERATIQFAHEDAGSAQVITWQPEYRIVNVHVPQATQMLWRTFDYPGWRLTVDGQVTPHTRGAYGEIVLLIAAGNHQVIAEFRATPIRAASNWITVIAAIIWLLLFFNSFKITSGRQQHATVGETF